MSDLSDKAEHVAGVQCCESREGETSCCKVEAVIAVDERGQMVLPKDLRDRAGIIAGEKLAVISWEAGGKICCISLMKTDQFADLVKEVLVPVMKGFVVDG